MLSYYVKATAMGASETMTKQIDMLIQRVKAELGTEEFAKLIQDARARKLTTEDCLRLNKEGKRDKARNLMAALAVVAENEPNEIIQETGEAAVAKRRGKIVVPDDDGGWKPKNPPRQKIKKKTGRTIRRTSRD